ncbi:MAG TPA: hypothetical protein VFV67_33825 [Actinophytocola sp.]|uniref:hypothetical protein n=1 Tax=Actinophytocola sp. TaxID=1872138 RepID=UPI002DBD8502|nr:hypothetical protein [Actinophytocola sp.]HEU5475649.1 hypothetical protein [Actinophytocola sp.]
MSAIDAAYDEAVKTVESCARKIDRACTDIANKVNWALKFVPDPLDGRIRAEMAKLTEKQKDSEVMFSDLWLERGSAGALRDAASAWTANVGAVASEHSFQLQFATLPSNGKWTGPAQQAYRPIVDLNSRVLGDFKNWTDDLNSTLNDLADALKAYWIAIGIEAVGCAATLAGCAIASGAVATLPATIATAVGAIIAFWLAVGGATVLYHNVLDAMQAKLEKITAINGTQGRWPHAGADLSDASVLDDDESDWEPVP